jgi:hypothetical protein
LTGSATTIIITTAVAKRREDSRTAEHVAMHPSQTGRLPSWRLPRTAPVALTEFATEYHVDAAPPAVDLEVGLVDEPLVVGEWRQNRMVSGQ